MGIIILLMTIGGLPLAEIYLELIGENIEGK